MKKDISNVVYLCKYKYGDTPWGHIFFDEDLPDSYRRMNLQERVFESRDLKILLLKKEYVFTICKQYPDTFYFFNLNN